MERAQSNRRFALTTVRKRLVAGIHTVPFYHNTKWFHCMGLQVVLPNSIAHG